MKFFSSLTTRCLLIVVSTYPLSIRQCHSSSRPFVASSMLCRCLPLLRIFTQDTHIYISHSQIFIHVSNTRDRFGIARWNVINYRDRAKNELIIAIRLRLRSRCHHLCHPDTCSFLSSSFVSVHSRIRIELTGRDDRPLLDRTLPTFIAFANARQTDKSRREATKNTTSQDTTRPLQLRHFNYNISSGLKISTYGDNFALMPDS